MHEWRKEQMPLLERHNGVLYFEVHGSGEPLLFLHGAGGNTLTWWQQISFFADCYQCIIVDHRGWGRSKGTLSSPWTETFVKDLEAILEEIGVDGFLAIAQSMGGWIIDAFCKANPGRIRAAVLSGSTGGYVPVAARQVYEEARHHSNRMRDTWRSGRGPHPALGERMYREQPTLAFLYESLTQLNELVKTSPHTGLPFTTDRLDLPDNTLFMFGDEDLVCPPEVIKAVAAETPGASTSSIPRSGHSVYFERAAAFNLQVRDFLSSY